jgi:hypothetical protein
MKKNLIKVISVMGALFLSSCCVGIPFGTMEDDTPTIRYITSEAEWGEVAKILNKRHEPEP